MVEHNLSPCGQRAKEKKKGPGSHNPLESTPSMTFHDVPPLTGFTLQRTFPYPETLWWSQLRNGRECYLLVGRFWVCCYTYCTAQDHPPNQKTSNPKCNNSTAIEKLWSVLLPLCCHRDRTQAKVMDVH